MGKESYPNFRRKRGFLMEILAGIAGGIVSGLGMGGGTVLIIFLSLFWRC